MSLKRLKACMEVQTTSRNVTNMIEYIRGELEDMGVDYTVDDDNVYATKGTAEYYPCFVAHTDTVHKIVDDFKVYHYNGRMFAMNGATTKQAGIGGDDKVGVYIALEALRRLPNAKAAFFRDEEIGCAGSRAAYMPFFDDVGYVLQADRRGSTDFIDEISWNKLMSDEILKKLKPITTKYGRKTVSGGPTDVGQLKTNGIKCCVANMSCGYYSPHTDGEYIVVSEVNDTLLFILDIVKTLGETFWKTPDKKSTYRNNYTNNGWSGVYNPNFKRDSRHGVHGKSTNYGRGSIGSVWDDSNVDEDDDVLAEAERTSKKKIETATRETVVETNRTGGTRGINTSETKDNEVASDKRRGTNEAKLSLLGLAESTLLQCGNCLGHNVTVELGDTIDDDKLYCLDCMNYVHPIIL